MASVFRRMTYAPIPAGAEIAEVQTKSGQTRRVAHWLDSDGRRQKADVVHHSTKGDRIRRELPNWYITYQSEHGRKQVKGYTDKAASIAYGDRLEREAARRREGLIEEFDDHARIPIDQHLNDFISSRPTNATSPSYLDQFSTRIKRIVAGTGAGRLHDLDMVKVDQFLNREGIVGHTRNEYVGCIKAFTRWSVDVRRLKSDPLVTLKKIVRKKNHPSTSPSSTPT